MADATVFDPHEARLSNLIEQYPALKNPVSDYLKADPNDSNAEGRLKNALEGIVAGVMLEPFVRAVKLIKLRHIQFKGWGKTRQRYEFEETGSVVPNKIKVGQFDDAIELAAQGRNSKGNLFPLKSQQADARLESQVARSLREELVDFQRAVPRKQGSGPLAEVDIEIPDFIIEVTAGKGGKVPQVRDRLTLPEVNPFQKPIIVFAPNFGKHAFQSTIQDGGAVAVFRSIDELSAFIKASRGRN